MRSSIIVPVIVGVLLLAGCQADVRTPALSEYAGQQDRAIKSLSEDDVDDLLSGRGWGFARAAELNGMPGPLHVLELREHLHLSDSQAARIDSIRRTMEAAAMPLGSTFVSVEKELNDRFARRDIDATTLRRLLDRSAEVRSDLAFVHLEAHLKTADVLSREQISDYNRLRGYAGHDPCLSVPEGHDPAMWRQHNNCPE